MNMKPKTLKEWSQYDGSVATAKDDTIDFGGRKWTPTRQMAFVVANLCHTLPARNSKKRAFTPETLANSFTSAEIQLCDFEHALEFYGADKDRICGVIVAAEFPSKKEAVELASEGTKVPMKVLIAVWRKAAGVEDALTEMASAKNPWRTSLEVEWETEDTAFYDGKKFTSWAKASEGMKDCIKPHTVESFKGNDLTLMMGGEDGRVHFTGAALTKYPADKDATVEQLVASANPDENKDSSRIVFGWRNPDDWRMAHAVASVRTLRAETASIVIGQTDPAADGHVHDITMNLEIMPADGHTHYFAPLNFDVKKGKLEGLTSIGGRYVEGKGWQDHRHVVTLGGGRKSEAAEADLKGLEEDVMKTGIQLARENAMKLPAGKEREDALAEIAKVEQAEASAVAAQGVEATIASRVKAGELVTKDAHAAAIAAAEKTARDSVEKAASEKAALDKKTAETLASRKEAVTKAGLKLDHKLGKERTIATVIASIPANEDGDKTFAERLDEWATTLKGTTDTTASDVTTGQEKPVVGAVATGSGTDAEKKANPAHAMM